MNKLGLPEKQGLYDPIFEKDNCGVGFIANIKGLKSHDILKQGLEILKNLKHRGAVGADASTGDGSGIMIQIPHLHLKIECEKMGIFLPNEGDYAVGMLFLPKEPNARLFCEGIFERVLREENQQLIGWREVPINENACGELAKATRPMITQIFIERKDQNQETFEKKLLIVRKRIQNIIEESKRAHLDNFYICSLSSRTIVYKGLVLGYQLDEFYLELQNELVQTAIAIVHERYSTNTFPSWKLAQPFRFLAHNGEINTIRGNKNWMHAREGAMLSNGFKDDLKKVLPIIESDGSDSSALDNALELFVTNGYSMEHAMMILIPEAWQNDSTMDQEKRAFYEYFARLMEPWDGPATVAFTDGKKIGVTLDRNGLRPARYLITKDGFMIMASEIGVVDVKPELVLRKGSVEPGKMLLIDTEEGRIVSDEEIKMGTAKEKPFGDWILRNKMTLQDINRPYELIAMRTETLKLKEKMFGYSKDELKNIIGYMADKGEEPISSMGMDIPLAILSEKTQLLFHYFKQNFAQVTNPPIDPIREKNIMSLTQYLGSHGKKIDEIEINTDYNYIELLHPILNNKQLEDIRHLNDAHFRAITMPTTFEIDRENGLKQALDSLCKRAEESIIEGYNILILSDRNTGRYNAPIPSLLALSAVHHHLIRKKLRTSVDIVVECGDARDVMHIALLIGYGAKAINPYMVQNIIASLVKENKYIKEVDTEEKGFKNYCTAISYGLLKIISRMGISTLLSYNGAQIFQAVGIHEKVIDEYFTHTPSQISGIDLQGIAEEVIKRHLDAYEDSSTHKDSVNKTSGVKNLKVDGEYHIFNQETVKKLREACKHNNSETYQEYTKEVNEEESVKTTIRGLLKFKKQKSISIDQVEPASEIIKRFTISGISLGSISKEAHETIAIAMNRIGATSNAGEGGEDPARYQINKNGDNLRSAVKQIAAGRFGVNTNYLVNCDELQIKVAQGAKPGEGGHLPGNKVTAEIAKVRYSIPGIDLISPPPHHDIYSIEDLAQLIFDLKNVNPEARIGVKLVSEAGVGTVAAGVAKGHADVVMISGHDGGTGASPISSMKYVGLPWELGLAETQQTLLLNNLRSRIRVQVDGKMRSGRDVVIAALLGAEEYGFATTALLSLGCLMCRQCHLNKCPVGIATQDINLRSKYEGKPEYLIQFLTFVAEEMRTIMAKLGFSSVNEMIGRVDVLEVEESHKEKRKDLDFSQILFRPELPSYIEGKCTMKQDHKIDHVLDKVLIQLSKSALENGTKVDGKFKIRNTDRTVGAMLSGKIAKKYGDDGLAEDTITLSFDGSAGQSFGAFLTKGLTMRLEGDANDYLGKGLSGGKIIVIPPKESTFCAEDNMIAGNTLLYGATAGEAYIQGGVGQRFCVRNSGATAVAEGIGDHGCEYMTGGTVVILGKIGKNFGAGMSGGVAYILDENQDINSNFNLEIIEIKPIEQEKDITTVKNMIMKHYHNTNSSRAKKILDNWEVYKSKFIKVSSPIYDKLLENNKIKN